MGDLASVSMEAFELRERDGVISIRVTGQRPAGSEKMTHRMVRFFDQTSDAGCVVLDIREAFYPLSPLQVEERARDLARILARHRLAVIHRPDQHSQAMVMVRAHGILGGESAMFRSRRTAMLWLDPLAIPAESEDAL